MGLSLLLEGAATAASTGLGCGTCCGSGMGVALSGYIMTHARRFREAWKGLAVFYLGKILAVVFLCCLASLAGNTLFADLPIRQAVDILMILAAIRFLIRWIRERRGYCACESCHGHPGPKGSPAFLPSGVLPVFFP